MMPTPTPVHLPALEDIAGPATRDHAGLPGPRLHTIEGAMDLRRTWPVPGASQPTLAVELDDGHNIRGGWWTAGRLTLFPAGTDPKLDGLKAAATGGVVISHRPGKRAVVHNTEAQQYVKVLKRGKASGVLDGIVRAAPFFGPFRTPEVLASTPNTVTFAALEGQSLHQADRFTAEQWTSAWNDVSDAWVQAGGPPNASAASGAAHHQGLIHRAEAETSVLRHWYQSALPWLKDAAAAEQSVEHVGRLLAGLPDEQLRPAHRDLHDKQLLWSPQSGAGLLDVDTACLADPALDLGNLRAHALLRRLQGVWTAAQAETVIFCVDEAAQRVGAAMSTVAVYEQSALLRLGFVYAVRPQYAAVAASLRELIRA